MQPAASQAKDKVQCKELHGKLWQLEAENLGTILIS